MSRNDQGRRESTMAHSTISGGTRDSPFTGSLSSTTRSLSPMTVYGMESAALNSQSPHRKGAFPAQSLRKMHSIPSTYTKTKVIAPDIPTTTNQQLRKQTTQPPLAHYIHRAQPKLFENILRAPEQCLERNYCFTKVFVYGGGVFGRVSEGVSPEYTGWSSVQLKPATGYRRPPNSLFAFVELHRLAVRRPRWSRLMGLPTCRKHLKTDQLQCILAVNSQ